MGEQKMQGIEKELLKSLRSIFLSMKPTKVKVLLLAEQESPQGKKKIQERTLNTLKFT